MVIQYQIPNPKQIATTKSIIWIITTHIGIDIDIIEVVKPHSGRLLFYITVLYIAGSKV